MARESQNPLGANSGPFWEFIRSMDNLGINQPAGPHPPPPNSTHPPPAPHRGPPGYHSHPPPPPPPGGFDFPQHPFEEPPFSGMFGGPRGRHDRGRGHGRDHHRRRSRTPSSSGSEFGSRSRSHSPHPHPEGDVRDGGREARDAARDAVRDAVREGRDVRDAVREGKDAAREAARAAIEARHEASRHATQSAREAARAARQAAREEGEHRPSSPHGGPHPHWGGRRGRRGWQRAGPPPFHFGFGGPHGPQHHRRGPPGPPPGPPPMGSWDGNANALIANLASQPFLRDILQNIGAQLNPQARDANQGNARNADGFTGMGGNDDSAFVPPTDVFTTPAAYILHISLPGAKKQDIDIQYSSTTSVLTVSGVIFRPGNEEFLATMTSSERRVGLFEKNVVLRGEAGSEIDGEGITAKLEDGVLVVTVPRVDREWEDVKTVEID